MNLTRPQFLHLFALSSVAIAQPLFDAFSRSPEFFVAHRLTFSDTAVVALLLCFVPPLSIVVLSRLVGFLSPRSGTWVGLLALATMAAALVLLIFKQTFNVDSLAVLPVAIVTGAFVVNYYRRLSFVRSFLTILGAGVIVFPALFLFASPVSQLRSDETDQVQQEAFIESSTPVVVVVFDQLPLASLMVSSSKIDSGLYPNFAKLSERAYWFRNASTVHNYTSWALPSILTGRYPVQSKLPTLSDHPENLFTMLAGSHDPHVFEPLTDLCPSSLCRPPMRSRSNKIFSALSDLSVAYFHILLPGALLVDLPPVNQGWKNFNFSPGENFQNRWVEYRDGDRRLGPLEFIESISPREQRPPLYFMHLLLPHEPFIYLPSGQIFELANRIPELAKGAYRWQDDEWAVAQAYQRHLSQVGYADTILKNIIDRLKASGLYEDSLFVVTSDHGASFRPTLPFKGVARESIPDVVRVPLFIKLPGQEQGIVDDRNVETIDVLPTIADILGAKLSQEVDGASALDSSISERTRKLLFTGGRSPRNIEWPKADWNSSVERKLALFGRSTGSFPKLLNVPYPNLVGQQVDSLRFVESKSGLGAVFQSESLYEAVDLNAEFLPVFLKGWIIKDRSFKDLPLSVSPEVDYPLKLAIALNGTIQATTQTLKFPVMGRGGFWSTFLEPDQLISGRNKIEIFLIHSQGSEVSFERVYGNENVTSDHNLILKTAEISGRSRLSGFSGPKYTAGREFRCLNGRGEVVVPVRPGQTLSVLDIDILRGQRVYSQLKILVNDCEVFDGRIPPHSWSQTLSLLDCRINGDKIRIEFLDDIPSSPDGTRLTSGACVEALHLN